MRAQQLFAFLAFFARHLREGYFKNMFGYTHLLAVVNCSQ